MKLIGTVLTCKGSTRSNAPTDLPEFITIEKRLDWLTGELEKARDKWVLFFSHVPRIQAHVSVAYTGLGARTATRVVDTDGDNEDLKLFRRPARRSAP